MEILLVQVGSSLVKVGSSLVTVLGWETVEDEFLLVVAKFDIARTLLVHLVLQVVPREIERIGD